jgi:hypothetical protein
VRDAKLQNPLGVTPEAQPALISSIPKTEPKVNTKSTALAKPQSKSIIYEKSVNNSKGANEAM